MRNIQLSQTKKSLTSKDSLGVIPLGKKGEISSFITYTGANVTLDYGASIYDNDMRNVNTCIAHLLSELGFDKLNEVENKPLQTIDEYSQVMFTQFRIKASDISIELYGIKREARNIAKSLEKIAKVMINIDNNKHTFTQVQRVAYDKGYVAFDVSNILINHLSKTRLPFRIKNTLKHQGFDYRLSFYVETHQYSVGKEPNQKWYPHQTYSLDELFNGLQISDSGRSSKHLSRTIVKIQDSFNNLHLKDNDFPKYIYDKDKKFFYNKYKKSADINIF